MNDLISFLMIDPVTAGCLGDISPSEVNLRYGPYGLRITHDYGISGESLDEFQATTFKVEDGQVIPGHHADILDCYWFSELSPKDIVKLFAQLRALVKE